MSEPRRTELSVRAERALLVGVILPGSSADPDDPLGELRSLARTAGAEVVDEMLARRDRVNPGMYVGTGKAQEIADRAVQNDADVIILDNDLSPNQIRELEELSQRKVLDRSELILDIFAARARTNESRLQVELAQLEYTYPRLSHMWSHLERMAGGATSGAAAVGGIGTRGPGEKQLEIDRRLVQKRISHLKAQIRKVDDRKVREVRSRGKAFSVCLVGYTNAGKSTLMNRLTGAGVLVEDKLFSTLDTRTRRWKLAEGLEVLLSDTVGFIRDLPHHLIASFHATLEEAIHADLLLHVADASHPRLEHQIRAVEGVLKDLGVSEANRILLLNKVDRVSDHAELSLLRGKYPQALLISAATVVGIEELAQAVSFRAGGQPVQVTLQADFRNGKLMQYIAQHAVVSEQTYDDSTTRIEATMTAGRLEGLRLFGRDVRIVEK
jgi:GTP-binding protein HflX